MNRPGGVGRIIARNSDGSYDVKYVLGGVDKSVEPQYVRCVELEVEIRPRQQRVLDNIAPEPVLKKKKLQQVLGSASVLTAVTNTLKTQGKKPKIRCGGSAAKRTPALQKEKTGGSYSIEKYITKTERSKPDVGSVNDKKVQTTFHDLDMWSQSSCCSSRNVTPSKDIQNHWVQGDSTNIECSTANSTPQLHSSCKHSESPSSIQAMGAIPYEEEELVHGASVDQQQDTVIHHPQIDSDLFSIIVPLIQVLDSDDGICLSVLHNKVNEKHGLVSQSAVVQVLKQLDSENRVMYVPAEERLYVI